MYGTKKLPRVVGINDSEFTDLKGIKMLIETRNQLKYVIRKDVEAYKKLGYKNWLVSFFMNNDV